MEHNLNIQNVSKITYIKKKLFNYNFKELFVIDADPVIEVVYTQAVIVIKKCRHYFNYFYQWFQDVSGQVVLITGGGGGVGKEMALNFARLNARVVIWDINSECK